MTAEKAWDALFHTKVSVSKGAWFPQAVSVPAIYPQTDCLLPDNTLGMDYIRAFISLSRENSIIPVLLTVPYPANESGQMEENSAILLSEEFGVPYYNLNTTDVIDWDTDLSDSFSHVNMSGGRKVTDFIGKLLVENYGVADHRGEPEYVSWNSDYEAYRQKVFDIMNSQTDLKTSLMLCNNSVFTARLSVKDGVELDSITQKLIAQLGDVMYVKVSPESQAHTVHLEVYDSDTGSIVSEKDWDFWVWNQFVYRN